MRIALMTDIHANREALAAALAQIRDQRVDRIVVLGDIVGYGADPAFCIDQMRAIQDEGGVVLLGNHDAAVDGPATYMNAMANAAIEWTRRQLSAADRAFLKALPLTEEDGERLYVHASAARPELWRYVTEPRDAEQSLAATKRRLTFCGHTHLPALFHAPPSRRAETFVPGAGIAIPLISSRRWVAVLGSTGQPRDGNAAAFYAIHDTKALTLTCHRVPYDVTNAARKIRAAGLPDFLAARLIQGR